MRNRRASPLAAFPLLLLSASAIAGDVAATADELRSMAEVLGCSASFITMGRTENESALVLSAGHCPGPSTYYKTGQAEAGTDLSGSETKATVFPPGSPLPQITRIGLKSLYYATMTTVDASLFETEKTIGELRESGHRFLEIADRLPRAGDTLRMTSGFWRATEDCEVERILEDSQAEKEVFGAAAMPERQFRNSVLMKSACVAKKGWSGAPLYDPNTGLIYGVISRLLERLGNQPGNFARFVRDFSGTRLDPSPESVAIVASNLLDLRDCLSSTGKLGLAKNGCILPKANYRPPAPRAPEVPGSSPRKAPSSRWPSFK